MIRKAIIASHPANSFTGQNAAIVTQFETEIIRQTAWNGLIFNIVIYLYWNRLPVTSSKYEV